MTGARLEVIGAWEVPWGEWVSPTKVDDDYFREVRERLEPAIARALEGADDVNKMVRMVPPVPSVVSIDAEQDDRIKSTRSDLDLGETSRSAS